jgi:hypothetical protein
MKRKREEDTQSVHFDQVLHPEIIDYIRILLHKLVIQDEEATSSNGIKKLVKIQFWKNCYDSGFHSIFVYLHPRELYIKWFDRRNEIPFEDLLNIKRVIIYLIDDYTSDLYNTPWANKQMGNEACENLAIFKNSWNIEKFRELKEKTEKEITFMRNRFRVYVK